MGTKEELVRGPEETFEHPGVATTKAKPAGPRYPGGKAALRLLQLLESSGQTQAAASVVNAAAPEGDREGFLAVAVRYSAAPTPEASATAAAETTDAATDISAEYLSVGQQMTIAPSEAAAQWRSLGPLTIPNGQTYGASRVNVSGRVAAIAVDPSNPAHVLVGAANGGVWESNDRGASWAPRTDHAATTAVGAVRFDPSNPRTVYCGTGEGNWWAYLGAGVLRSTNGGGTWSQLCTTPFVGQGFYELIVDHGNGSHLLAGVTNGLYVSTDGGSTWTSRRSARTWAISMTPIGGASAEILAACADGLFHSADGGTTWTGVALPGSPGAFDRLSVALAPSNPSVAYAWGAGGSTAYLWRRAAGTWTAVAPPPGVSTGQAWYDWYLAVSPDNDSQIYLGAIDSYRGDLSGSTWTWLDISTKGAGQDSIHPDQHAIAFEPGHPDTIYVGCDGGLFRSDNRGVNWTHCNNGLVISEFEYLAQNNSTAQWLIGGTQDNGTDRWTGSGTWDHIADGDGGDCGVNQTLPTTVFHTYYGMSPERSTTSGNFGSWTGIAPPVPSGEGALFYPPFGCSTSGDTIAMGGGRLYVSRDRGSTWTAVAYPSAGTASALYIPNIDNVYVGLVDGRLFRLTWGGTGWGAITALATPRASAYVSDLFVDPSNLKRIWATSRTVGGPRVFRSDDSGATWLDKTAGLPGLPINAIAVDPTNANRVWVGADLGVYESPDAGATWHHYYNGLPSAYVGDLVFHPQARRLRAGTRNRGVWEIPVDSSPDDYDRDGKTDFAVWRPSNGTWYVIHSSDGSQHTQQWGTGGDVPVPGDYDGDGKTDFAVWRPSNGTWYVIHSSDGSQHTQQWGTGGDVPVPGDYDGDGKTDFAVWRPSNGTWYVIHSSDGSQHTQQWGTGGDVPVPGDYDGDGKTDFAVWRPSNGTWYVIHSSDGSQHTQQWGTGGDVPVPGDYDGDGKTDFAVWRPSNGTWYVIHSSDGSQHTQQWGTGGDVPVPGDYDGDGKTDFAVWRPSNGTWYVIHSSDGSQHTQQWGTGGDVPVG